MAEIKPIEKAAHREAMETSPQDIAKILQDALGQKLVAHMVGRKDPKTIGRWAAGDSSPGGEAQKLRDTYQIFSLLQAQESKHTIKAWFVGMNPQLGDDSPATALAEGRKNEVMLAAKAFLTGG